MNKPNIPNYLNNISIVLSRTSHPSNIGSAARAMKTMGLSRLVLVAPDLMATPMTPNPPIFDAEQMDSFRLPEESFILASGARDVLENARMVASLSEALADTVISCALTSRKRELTVPLYTPREMMPQIIQAAAIGQECALVFGNETFGLNIDEVALCNRLLTINGNPDYFSLNLAQAVQVVAYELFTHTENTLSHLQADCEPATHQQVSGLCDHFAEVMDESGFFARRQKTRLMRRVRRLFDRAQVEREEVDILRGFLKTVSQRMK